MNEALILEKLDKLSEEVRMLRSESVHKEVRNADPESSTPPPVLSRDGAGTELTSQLKVLTQQVADLQQRIVKIQADVDANGAAGASGTGTYPKTMQILSDVEKNLPEAELTLLLENILNNLNVVGEGLDLLRAGVELRDDMLPVMRLVYPRFVRFFGALHEGEFQTEKLSDLLHTMLINIHTFSDLLNMIQPFTEFIKETAVVLKQTDVLHGINTWLDGFQQGSGPVKLLGVLIRQVKTIDISEQQIEALCQTIEEADFSHTQPVGALGLLRQLKDPAIQEALGFIFALLKEIGNGVQNFRAEANTVQ
jgi:hypothetical protein